MPEPQPAAFTITVSNSANASDRLTGAGLSPGLIAGVELQ